MLLNEYIGKDFASYEELKKGFSIPIPENFNFAYDVVDRYAKDAPDKEALVWCNDQDDTKRFTFKDLAVASDKTANYLKKCGIKKGDAVLLVLRRHYEFWYFLLALHKIGAIAVPATHLLMEKDFEYRNNAASIKMIVAVEDKDLQDRIDAAMEQSPTVETLVSIGPERKGWQSFPQEYKDTSDNFIRPPGSEAPENEDISLLYFTSGTTGYPKMVQHNFTYPLGHIVTAKYWQNVTEDGLHLTVADTGWAKAMWGKIYGQWIAGCAVFAYDMDSFVPEKLLEKMVDFKVTSFCAPPTIYRYLIKEDLSRFNLSHLNYCSIAGEPLNPEVYNRFLDQTGLKLHEGYGQTELTLTIGTFPWMEPKPGSMGKPAPGYDVEIIHPNGIACDTGEVGEIVLNLEKGHPFGMFAGYYQDKVLTDQAFENGTYHTGDTAWKDEDGYYWFVGRIDDMIKSSGYRIGPFEVESALLTNPAVLECAITAVPDPDRGQVVKATIVLSKGFVASDQLATELQNYVKKTTAPYKYPRIVEFVKELPKTISGKIRRVEIREGENENN